MAPFLFAGAAIIRLFFTFYIFFFYSSVQYSTADTSNLAILFSANVMGFYFVASVLLFRVNLPEVYRRIITEVLGSIQVLRGSAGGGG